MDKKPSLTAETILTALAVLAAGCGKKESAPTATVVAEPEKQATSAAAATAPPAPTPATPPVATVADPAAAAPSAVDAPKQVKPKPTAPSKGSHAACGAGQCSPDMKKGN